MTALVLLSRTFFIVVLFGVGVVGDARAQLADAPVGAIGGIFGGHRSVDPNRDSQSFETTLDLSGGYDRDPSILIGVPDGASDLTRWYAGTGSALARYRAGSTNRNLEVRARSFMNYQSTAGNPLFGGEGIVNGSARPGRRRLNQMTVSLQSSYQPGWIFGAFGPSVGAPSDSALGVSPPIGVFEQRWLLLSGTGGYEHHWNGRHVTVLGYQNRRLRPVAGAGLDTDSQFGSLEQRWAVSRRVSLFAGYRLDGNSVQVEGGPSPGRRRASYQSADAGFRYERRMSPVRRVSMTVRGGLTRLFDTPETAAFDVLHPNVLGNIEIVPSRRFNLLTQYTRGVTVLIGISAVPVVNDAIELTASGLATRRLRYSILTSAARADSLAPDQARATTVAGAAAEARYALTNWAGAFVSYAYYRHRIDDPTLEGSGFPSRYIRHSIRVGLTLWAPLYGTF